jgi:hypothetical protein
MGRSWFLGDRPTERKWSSKSQWRGRKVTK